MFVGIIGAVAGGMLFALFGPHSAGLVWSMVSATVGAIVILYFPWWFHDLLSP